MSEQLKCKECGGTFLTWSLSLRHTTNIAGHNRLGLHNVAVDAVLGCEDCSATLKVVDGQKMVDEMVTTSARLESALAAEREKVVALEAENEGLLKLDVHTLNAVVGRLEATVGSPAAVRILAMSFAAFLRENKGENFCTVDCVDSSDPENPVAMSVTVARKGRKSTAEVLDELRTENTTLTDRVRGLEGALRQISELGIFQTTSAAIDIARAALTPTAPAKEKQP